MKKLALLASTALLLQGCASIVEGTHQDIAVNTNPPQASCDFTREGLTIAHLAATPASATIEKSKEDVTVICRKAGYSDATYLNHSGTEGWFWGNFLWGVIGFPIAMGIDAATGGWNSYDDSANLTLMPQALVPAAAASPSSNSATPGLLERAQGSAAPVAPAQPTGTLTAPPATSPAPAAGSSPFGAPSQPLSAPRAAAPAPQAPAQASASGGWGELGGNATQSWSR